MMSSWYKFTILFAISLTGILANSNNSWCVPNVVTYKECNKCWCMGVGIPVCTRLPCHLLPSHLFEAAPEGSTYPKRVRLFGIFDPIRNYISNLIAQTAGELSSIIRDKVADYLKSVVEEQIAAMIKKFALHPFELLAAGK